MIGARPLLKAILAFSILHLVALLAWAAIIPREPAPGPMLPAAGGPLSDLAIQFHRAVEGEDRFLPVFGDILLALDPSTTVHVVVGDAEDRRIFEEARGAWFPNGGGPTVVYAVADRPITSWMRDRLAVLAPSVAGAPITLLAPAAPTTGPESRANDWVVPWVLGDSLGDGARVRSASYRFDGGDLIADEDRVYVATPLLARNPGMEPSVILRKLGDDAGLPVMRLGDADHPVPNHHIGMFVTPIGDGRVGVGDPDLAIRALVQAGAPTSWTTSLPQDGVLQLGGEPIALDLEEAALEPFREVGRELQSAGLEVISIPILPTRDPFVFLTYNNLLAERREDGRLHLYMPVYGIAPLDEAATLAWEAAGAVVHPIRAASIVRLGGSVRCVVAPLRFNRIHDAELASRYASVR